MTALDTIREADYRIGNCAARRYDRNSGEWPENYLAHLYDLCLKSGRRDPRSFIYSVFGGNPPSHFDSIVPFFASVRPIILGVYDGEKFQEAGITFPIIFCGSAQAEAAAFCGFGFFAWSLGSPELDTLSILGLAMLFQELKLVAIHGTRFIENTLAARFTERFGFRDIGTLPHYHLKDGKLVPTVISTLSREDFEKIAERVVVTGEVGDGNEDKEASEDFLEPQKEEGAKESVAAYQTAEEAALKLLVSGEVKAVWFPVGTRVIPEIPAGMESCIVDGGFTGDGVWYFNPKLTSALDIWVAAGNGKHADLLAPVRVGQTVTTWHISEVGYWPEGEEPKPPPKMLTLQAVGAGKVIAEATIPATADAITIQTETFEKLHPACTIQLKPERKRGRNGGRARAAKMTQKERSDNARAAASARWRKGNADAH